MLLIPVLKKGDLLFSDNWHGISLLEVLGKVFAKIFQRRMQVDVVVDAQFGIRSCHVCADMVFCGFDIKAMGTQHQGILTFC